MANAILCTPYFISNFVVEGSAAGTTPANLTNDLIGMVHRGTATSGNAQVFADLGSDRPVGVVALLSCAGAAGNMQLLGGPTSGSGSVYNSGVVPFRAGATATVSGRSNSLMVFDSPPVARWWSTLIEVSGAPFEAGRLVIGEKLQLGRNFSFGAAFGILDRGGYDFSDQAVPALRPGRKQRTIGISFSHVTREEAESAVAPLLEQIGNSGMVLLVTDPAPDTLRQRRMYYGPLVGNLEQIWRTSNGFEWRANLVSII